MSIFSLRIRFLIISSANLFRYLTLLFALSLSNKYLYSNINTLEKQFDNNGKWRKYYNEQLKTKYSNLFNKFDSIIYLKAPSFKHVLNWRKKQEDHLYKLNKKSIKTKMSYKEIENFIQYYEKITKWMFKETPKLADIVLYINKDQKISKLIKN